MGTNYFAYGSNMEVQAMSHRCPRSHPLGIARLDGWSFRINTRGYATVVPCPGEVVYGLLWSLDEADELLLDDYEAVHENLYTRTRLEVTPATGVPVGALVYLATHSHPGKPLPGYLEGILEAARSLRFPETYQRELERWK